VPEILNNKWVLYGGAGAIALVALFYFSGQSTIAETGPTEPQLNPFAFSSAPFGAIGSQSDLGASRAEGADLSGLISIQGKEIESVERMELARIGAFRDVQLSGNALEQFAIRAETDVAVTKGIFDNNALGKGTSTLFGKVGETSFNVSRIAGGRNDGNAFLQTLARTGAIPAIPDAVSSGTARSLRTTRRSLGYTPA
jgi:hypothetical protein